MSTVSILELRQYTVCIQIFEQTEIHNFEMYKNIIMMSKIKKKCSWKSYPK